jgi:CheY-like chemotaxis protein
MAVDYRIYPILYVDDEPSNLVALRYALEDQFTIVTAQSGEEALRLLAAQDIAVLIADQRMPGMTGAEVCARAMQLKPTRCGSSSPRTPTCTPRSTRSTAGR